MSSKTQFTILTDRSHGGSSLKDGSLELMVCPCVTVTMYVLLICLLVYLSMSPCVCACRLSHHGIIQAGSITL